MTAGQPRKVGVVFCEHPDEAKSREVLDYFRKHERRLNPLVEYCIGNEVGYPDKKRLMSCGKNLAKCYPGDADSWCYADRRAAQLTAWGWQCDIVLSIHGTVENADNLWLNPMANLTLRGLTSVLRMKRIVSTAPLSNITNAVPHAAMIELGANTHIEAEDILKMTNLLAIGKQWHPPEEVEWYQFLTGFLKSQHYLPPLPELLPFEQVPLALSQHLDIPEDTVVLFDDPNAMELATPIEDPWLTRIKQRKQRLGNVACDQSVAA